MKISAIILLTFFVGCPAFAQLTDLDVGRLKANNATEAYQAAKVEEEKAQVEFERQTKTLFGHDIRKMAQAQDALIRAKKETARTKSEADEAARQLQGESPR